MNPEEYAHEHGLEFRGTREENDLTFAEFRGTSEFYTLVTDYDRVDGVRLNTVEQRDDQTVAIIEGETTPRRVDRLGVHDYIND